jgi:ankyrin repeat protein
MLLQTASKMRAIVLEGPLSAPYSLSPHLVKPPGIGECTCCRVGHRWYDKDGKEHTMACDRVVIRKVTENMLRLRVEHESSRNVNAWRAWRAWRAYFVQGLPTASRHNETAELALDQCAAAEGEADPEEQLTAFLSANKFDNVNDGGNGISPLMCAAAEGNAVLVRALLNKGADATAAYKGEAISNLMLIRGTTALHLAAAFGQSAACVELLVRHGASIDARAGSFGGTPLQGAATTGEQAVRAVVDGCAAAKVPLDVNAGARLNNASALGIAGYMGPPSAVAALLEVGADTSHRNDNGGFVWSDVCQNPQTTLATLEQLKRQVGMEDINMRSTPRNMKWALINHIFEFLERTGLGRSSFVHDMSNGRRSTPLHRAALGGRLEIVQWLLANGATPSLNMRNARGRTPLQLARKYAPHLAVEAELSRQEMLRSTATQHGQLVSSTRKSPAPALLSEQRRVASSAVV